MQALSRAALAGRFRHISRQARAPAQRCKQVSGFAAAALSCIRFRPAAEMRRYGEFIAMTVGRRKPRLKNCRGSPGISYLADSRQKGRCRSVT
jgi:hypothetical protein